MKILCAHCDFSPVSLALMNLKSYAEADPELKGKLEFRFITGFPQEDPELTMSKIMDAAAEFKPQIVALSLYVWSRYRMYEVSRRLKAAYPDVKIVWGGPDVSDAEYAKELMGVHAAVDLIVRDEGERTFARILHHELNTASKLPLADISGLSFRNGEELVSTKTVEFLENLDDIPSMLDLPEVKSFLEQTPVFALETFRGCYMGCAYCYWGGTARRAYSDERVFSDLERILAFRNIKKIWFFDSMFGHKKSLAKKMLRFIVEKKAPDQNITFFPNLDFLDEELCRLMKEAGVYIEAGIQTINEEAYEYLNRKWDKRFLDSKIPLLEKYGLRANAQQLILGLPGDDLDGFRRSVDYAFDTGPDSIQVFPFSVLPATGYWRRRDEFNVKHEGEYRIVYDSMTFPEDDMITGGHIMTGSKWYEGYSGLARQIVALLRIQPAEWFEHIGRAFMNKAWTLSDTPETRPEVRTRVLCQGFSEEEIEILRAPALMREVFAMHYADTGLKQAFEELLRLSDLLNHDLVLDARVLPEEAVAEAMADWKSHPEALPQASAEYNVFEASSYHEEGGRDPVEFVAWPVEAPKDFFGKDQPKYRILVLGSEQPHQSPAPTRALS